MNPKLGVCYYPEHWPEDLWARDAAEMVDMGLSLVRIGEFAWSRLEPVEGQFEFEWLDRAIDILGNAGLKVILGTPSATPPRWVLNKFPDMLAYDENGNPRKFGSRRHYCFSHAGYRAFAAKIAGVLAERYGKNPHIHSWQTDNEYGCHDTILSYSPVAKAAFQNWLSEKYKTVEKLNSAWGNIFWSMDYARFDEIDLPNLTVTEPNPAHVMDFRRFSSDQVVIFNKAQCDAIRVYSDRPIIHNYMGRITEFDHFKVGKDLEIASWDSYPLGFLEDRSDRGEAFRHRFQRQGDPDFQAFHHDIYRAVGKGRWGIMEQQPGPVNWAPYNPAPLPGMVRVWTWEAIAHGAEFVCYFRWRQPSFAQEQMHTALKRPDNSFAPVCDEVRQVAEELKTIKLQENKPAKIGLVFDYESQWAWEAQPQGKDFDYFRLVYEFYCGLRTLGQSIDIVSPNLDRISNYDFLIVPGMYSLDDEVVNALKSFAGKLLLGPRTNHKDSDFKTRLEPLNGLRKSDLTIENVETLRPRSRIRLETGAFYIWQEHVRSKMLVQMPTADGNPALLSHENLLYLAGWPDGSAMQTILLDFLEIKERPLPQGLRHRRRGDQTIVWNYDADGHVIHEHEIGGCDVLINPVP